MTGMERNSDIVIMGSYAPLFCNVNHKSWPINLINYDNSRWYGLPSYYVQQMFANNQGTVVLPLKVEGSPMVDIKGVTGGIGLGTWKNAAEFKDLKVVTPDGTVLYQNDFSKNIDDWTKTGNGIWSVQDGVLKQSSLAQGVTAYVGEDSWKDYTLTVKARKLYGENGFQIYFHNPGKRGRNRWDLGGYNNTVNEMQTGVTSGGVNFNIEEGRWYDVKIEIKGNIVKGYLDGKLIQEAGDSRTAVETLFASASLDGKTGDIILKVVNADKNSIATSIDLKGAGKLPANAIASVLTSASPLDENSLDEPIKVSPKIESLSISGKKIIKAFPGNSLTVIRIPTVK
jgi:alpha-L-arabinofuranosidase